MGWLPARRETTDSQIEQRAPRASTRAVGWYSREHPMPTEWDAHKAFRYAYIANSIVFRCVQIIANDIAALPIRIGPDWEKPTSYRANHPLAKLLAPPPLGPNPRFSAHTLISHAVASYIVAGRFGWELELQRGRSDPAFIWPLVTHNLRPVPTNDGPNYFREFWYEVIGADRHVKLSPNQIHYQWRPSQLDFRQPESLIQAARLDISVAVMQDRYDYAFLQNDARPAAIIVHEHFEEEGAKEEFRSSFLNTHQGYDNAGKVAWAERDPMSEGPASESFYIETLGLSQRDAEFAKRYEAKIRNIAISMGVPFSKLDASGRTFSNAEAEDKTYWTDTIRPLANELAGNISVDLLPKFAGSEGLACWFDFSSVEALKPHVEPVTQKASVIELRADGIMSLNEARADYGLAPVKDAGADDLQKAEPPLPPPQFGNGNGSSANSSIDEDTRSVIRSMAYKPPTGDISQHFEREMRKVRIIRETDTVINTLEQMVEREFRQLFAQQEKATISRLEGRRGKTLLNQMPKIGVENGKITTYPISKRQAVGNIFDFDFWRNKTAEMGFRIFEAIFTQGGLRAASKLGLSFDVAAPYAQEYIQTRANKLAGNVTDTTYQAIVKTLSEGVNFGESIPQLSKRIRQVFSEASKNRAKRIARTEVIGAYNGSAARVANIESFAGIVAQEWIATDDERTRDSHHGADGQVVAIGERFRVGDSVLEYPGDPGGPPEEIINCRCTIGFYTALELGIENPPASLPELTQQESTINWAQLYEAVQSITK